MRIAKIETVHCDAGWRNYSFVKVTTESGVTGWGEFLEAIRSPGLDVTIQGLSRRIIGQDVRAHERIMAELYCQTRTKAGGMIGEAMGALENALMDTKARVLGVPCYELLGGKIRDRIPVYWSHCCTFRVERPEWYGEVNTLDDVRAAGREVRERGFNGLKTNVFRELDGKITGWAPGFGNPYEPDLNVSRKVLDGLHEFLVALREGTGPDIDIKLDLNFHCKTEGFLQILRRIQDLDMSWIEIDSYNAPALAYIRDQSPFPIASCEALIGPRAFLPFFKAQAMDVAIIDVVWNGAWNSLKTAMMAEAFETNVAVHNLYSHHSTMMNAQFLAAVPNMAIMEIDIDRIPWDDELFDISPTFEDGCLIVPDGPGWGIVPNEEAMAARPAKRLNFALQDA